MSRTCTELFEGYPCKIIGDGNVPIEGLSSDSRHVSPEDAFFCINGTVVDGHRFASSAVADGATVIVVSKEPDLPDGVTCVMCDDTRDAMAFAASRFFDDPSAAFDLIGITGTNGKTTVTHLIEHIAGYSERKCAVVGTIGVKIADEYTKTERTTPDSIELQSLFAELRDEGCDIVALEVSSHALDLKRVLYSRFAVTAFTNLTHDHLDYHHCMEAYFEAKALLFSEAYPSRRVIEIDSEWGRELEKRCRENGDDILTCGFSDEADIFVVDVDYLQRSTRVSLNIFGEVYGFEYPLVGRFNVENVLVAMGIACQLGFEVATTIEALLSPTVVPGRMQNITVSPDQDINVYVDYAHTPDALANALKTTKDITENGTILIFGCEGDRDTEKRPMMGSISLGADLSIVSSDNVRTEDRLSIIDDVLEGMTEGIRLEPDVEACRVALAEASASEGQYYVVLPERRDAIAFAVKVASEGDSVLIAGKGHEDYEVIGTNMYHLDDSEEAAAALKTRMDSKEL